MPTRQVLFLLFYGQKNRDQIELQIRITERKQQGLKPSYVLYLTTNISKMLSCYLQKFPEANFSEKILESPEYHILHFNERTWTLKQKYVIISHYYLQAKLPLDPTKQALVYFVRNTLNIKCICPAIAKSNIKSRWNKVL